MASTKLGKSKKGSSRSSAKRASSTLLPLNCVYFYYVTFQGGKRRINAYYYFKKNPTEPDLVTLIGKLIKNARDDGDDPPCYGTGFSDLKRRRKGYFVVAVDVARYQFDSSDGIVLEEIYWKSGSHTFTPSVTVPVSVPGTTDTVSVAYCINRMRKYGQNRELAEGESEEFLIRLNPTPTARIRLDDSGGTNMGPPVPPPFVPPGRRVRGKKPR